MTISIWRYSHLALAVSSFVFIILASISGIILAFQPISEQVQPYKVANLNTITLAETLAVFQDTYPEVIAIKIDANNFVEASVFTENGKDLNGYFNPKTGVYLGKTLKPSPFFQWVTNFHRSLFLKSTGRLLVGLCSFLLCLIAVTGTVLIVKRQQGITRFFSKIINDNFNQYWHVVLGRLSLIPIIIITFTGVYLSLEKFDMLPNQKIKHHINFETISETPRLHVSQFQVFKTTMLSDVKRIEFPFSASADDYFTLELHDKQLLVNQITGKVLSEVKTSKTQIFSALSFNLHTGKGSIVWSIILAIATANILFFVYSGFAMTLKRRKSKLSNKFKSKDAEIIILVGSENGSTISYANAFYNQLVAKGKHVFIAEMNSLANYAKAKYLVVFTATYGHGNAPTNANKFLQKLKAMPCNERLLFSVVGFGSLAYPDFCKFAIHVNEALKQKARTLLPICTINDRSVESFSQWITQWAHATKTTLAINETELALAPKKLKTFKVLSKTDIVDTGNSTFTLVLKPKGGQNFKSGDLLAIYPNNDYRERLYSIGKVNRQVYLSVKLHQFGMGSNFLYKLKPGSVLKAKFIKNKSFYFPKQAKNVILIANGTGIAPFLGMIDENNKHINTHLYWGIRKASTFKLHAEQLNKAVHDNKLTKFSIAYSQQGTKQYVQDILKNHSKFIAACLTNNGVIMLCGSLSMQTDVLNLLEKISQAHGNTPLSYYINNNQIKMDCY